MRVIDHNLQPTEEWRPGVLTRMNVSALTNAVTLCLFEQWCAPGTGAPTHSHPVEEILTISEGLAEIWLGEERVSVSAGQSVVVPAGLRHGFRNAGTSTLHIRAVSASPAFEALADGQGEPIKRWLTE